MKKVLLTILAILVLCMGVYAEDSTTIESEAIVKGTVSGTVISTTDKDITIEAAPYFKERKPSFAIVPETKMWMGPEVGADAVKIDYFKEMTKVVIYFEDSIAIKIIAFPNEVLPKVEEKADTSVKTDTK